MDPSNPSSNPAVRETCLYAHHVAHGAVLVDFHGWAMPLRYQTIPEEHQKVRLCAGLFDLCHMGRLEVSGKDTGEWVGRVITNDYDAMRPGDARYTLICDEEGRILDDAIVYKLPQSAFLVVNASNRVKIIEWMERVRRDVGSRRGSVLDARLTDRSEDIAMVAIQGPQAVRILPAAVERFDGDWETMKYYSLASCHIFGKAARIARTGYTGEDGFEVYLEASDAPPLWERLLEIGGNRIAPVGLGARDTLRLEAGMPLYGNDIDEATNPFEAGLAFAVKLSKSVEFVGRESLRAAKERGPSRVLRGFRVLGRRVARAGMDIRWKTAGDSGSSSPGRVVGKITSGAPSPTLGYPIAMGYVDKAVVEKAVVVDTEVVDEAVAPGQESPLVVDVRGRAEPIQIETLPFYSRTRKKTQ